VDGRMIPMNVEGSWAIPPGRSPPQALQATAGPPVALTIWIQRHNNPGTIGTPRDGPAWGPYLLMPGQGVSGVAGVAETGRSVSNGAE
jgi:hypothetical protein